jgi:putative DNA primase/helicase
MSQPKRLINSVDALSDFRRAMENRGLIPEPGRDLIADGKFHRADVIGKKRGNRDGSYLFRLQPVPFGVFNNWIDGYGNDIWLPHIKRELTAAERREVDEAVNQWRREDQKQRAEANAEARTKAKDMWRRGVAPDDDHEYCRRKGIKPRGLRMFRFRSGATPLLVPMYDDDGKLCNLHFIHEDGHKHGLRGGPVNGCHYWICKPQHADTDTIVICEGWSTGETIYQATGHAVVISFGSGNLPAAAQWTRKAYPKHHIIVAADDDKVGISKAQEAARAVNGRLALPKFGNDRRQRDTDFNDLARLYGRKAVKRDIAAAVAPAGADYDQVVLPAGAPLVAAEEFIKRCSLNDFPLLWSYRGAFYRWTGTHYLEYADEDLERELYTFLNTALVVGKKRMLVPYNPTKNKVLEVVHALRRKYLISRDWETPCWLRTKRYKSAASLVACRNGILNLETRQLRPHDPLLFITNCLPLDYDPQAPKPKRWHQFLEELWPADKDGNYDKVAKQTLQEISGYLLTADTGQQKIFLIIGPPRSGKGTIIHVLVSLLGEDNCVFPTLASMSGEFGKWPLIDKKLATITDARISSKADTHRIAEILLSISGGDPQTINRKNQAFWTGRLRVRFVITTNVLPAIRDPSGTIATRYILLKLTESFLGREDKTLQATLSTELGGILNWALDGLDRLRKRGYFRLPASSKESIRELEDAAEPVRAFLREWCEDGVKQRVNVKELYRSYRAWAEDAGQQLLAKNAFGRALRGQVPKLRTTGHGAKRAYIGVALSDHGQEQFDALMKEKGTRR